MSTGHNFRPPLDSKPQCAYVCVHVNFPCHMLILTFNVLYLAMLGISDSYLCIHAQQWRRKMFSDGGLNVIEDHIFKGQGSRNRRVGGGAVAPKYFFMGALSPPKFHCSS